jgi:hypothetical protein
MLLLLLLQKKKAVGSAAKHRCNRNCHCHSKGQK